MPQGTRGWNQRWEWLPGLDSVAKGGERDEDSGEKPLGHRVSTSRGEVEPEGGSQGQPEHPPLPLLAHVSTPHGMVALLVQGVPGTTQPACSRAWRALLEPGFARDATGWTSIAARSSALSRTMRWPCLGDSSGVPDGASQ